MFNLIKHVEKRTGKKVDRVLCYGRQGSLAAVLMADKSLCLYADLETRQEIRELRKSGLSENQICYELMESGSIFNLLGNNFEWLVDCFACFTCQFIIGYDIGMKDDGSPVFNAESLVWFDELDWQRFTTDPLVNDGFILLKYAEVEPDEPAQPAPLPDAVSAIFDRLSADNNIDPMFRDIISGGAK